MPHPLTIDDLAAQGDGVAHHEGRAIFVAGTLAGERVRVEASKDPLRPKLVEILEASPDRIAPMCPHFLVCGGCKLQHMAPAAMTAWMEETLRKTLSRADLDVSSFAPTHVSPLYARRRARLAAFHGKNGIILGFNKERSPELVDLKTCPLLVPALENLLPALRQNLALWLPKNETCDLQLTALPDGLDLVLIGGRPLDLESREILSVFAETLSLAQLSWKKWDRSPAEPVAFRRPLAVRFGETDVPFPAGSFLQATQDGAEALIAFTRQAVGSAARVLDLFCGLGGFGLSLLSAKTLYFADLDGPAITALRRAVQAKGCGKGKSSITVEERNLARDPMPTSMCNGFDAIIFDPPRGGAKAQAQRLAASTCPCVVAISCDPPSFARDAAILIAGGYKLEKLQPIDQFLWSPHLELAAHFVKNKVKSK